ncbi:MAG: molybdate ABC transporter permease subunit, partial [Okeania sp. SIO2H7]|nr:molybdate ABC transporter permease subunit [Okeania sp. SIO2H7]
QRIALARAFASQPEILLLDEPFSALDTHLRDRLEKLLIANVTNYRGVTLFITHNLEEAYRVCHDLLVIEGGKIVAQGVKQNIFERPPTLSVAKLTGCKNFSRVVARPGDRIEAIDWGCTLKTVEEIPESLSHVGIRAHQIAFVDDPYNVSDDPDRNIFPCWLVATSETPHRMTLFLKLHEPPTDPQDYHLQAEVFKEKWYGIEKLPFPWGVSLQAARLILV